MRGNSGVIFFTAILILFLMGGPASAGSRAGPYFGGGLGVAMHDGCEDRGEPGSDNFCRDVITNHDVGFKIFGGFRFHDYVGFEMAYYDLGDALDDDEIPDEFNIYGGAFSILGILPIDEGSNFFIKLGGFIGDVEEYDRGSDTHFSDTGISLLLGAGAEFRILSNFSVRGELEWIPNLGGGEAMAEDTDGATGDIDSLFASVNLVWHFLGLQPERPVFSTDALFSSPLGWYAGGGIGLVSFDGGEIRDTDDPRAFDDNISDIEVGGKVFGGYRFHENIAVEVGYHYFNTAHDDDANFDTTPNPPDAFTAQGFSFSLLGILPVFERTSVFGRIGGFWGILQEEDPFNDSIVPEGSEGNEFTDHGVSFMAGAGFIFDLSRNVSLRGEVEWVPDIGLGDRECSPQTDQAGACPDDVYTGKTAEIDIINSSLSLIWNFR